MARITRSQKIERTIYDAAEDVVYKVELRHDDTLGNGHNSFALTGESYRRAEPDERVRVDESIRHEGHRYVLMSCGAIGDELARLDPALGWANRFHLCSTDGPMHYIANTMFHAGARDCNGLLKGEVRQFTDKATGLPQWLPDVPLMFTSTRVTSAEQPEPLMVTFKPWGIEGEGHEPELDAARRCAIWPDATDDDLLLPGLRERLEARLPALLQEFQTMVESFGLVYEAPEPAEVPVA